MTERRSETGPGGEIVASYGSYEGARRAVDNLSDEGFPVERLSIVGEDLGVDQTMGREGYGLASAQGAGAGALVGIFFGAFGPFGPIEPPVPATIPALMGLIVGLGAITGLISHASSGRRGFSSAGAIRAGRYGVVVADEGFAGEARGMLTGLGGNLRRRAS